MASDSVIIPRDRILEVIPQRHPFVMVDQLVAITEKETTTSLTIRNDNIFCRNGKFLEPGLVENIAQTAASRAGYESVLQNKPAPVGYIGAVKALKVFDLPEEGSTIYTTIFVEHRIMEVSLIRGKVMCDGNLIAECEMKIFEAVEK